MALFGTRRRSARWTFRRTPVARVRMSQRRSTTHRTSMCQSAVAESPCCPVISSSAMAKVSWASHVQSPKRSSRPLSSRTSARSSSSARSSTGAASWVSIRPMRRPCGNTKTGSATPSASEAGILRARAGWEFSLEPNPRLTRWGCGMRSWLPRRKVSREGSLALLSATAAAIWLLGGVPGALHAQASPTIALVVGVKGDPFYVTMQKGAQAEADKMGAELIVDGPAQFDAVQQTPIVDALIARRIDALIIAATDKQAMIEPLRRANDAGIQVISVDTFIGDGDYENGPVTFPLSYIGSDNLQGGRIGCEALIAATGGGKFYIQNVKPGISTTDQREQGCKDAIEASGDLATLVGVDYNNDSAAISAQQTTAVLQRTPDLVAIFGANLFSAEGAAQAVKNANLTGSVRVANFDAPEQAIADLRGGAVDLVIAQRPAEMGVTGVDYALMALSGDTTSIQKRVPTGYVVINRDNVDTDEAQAAIYKSQ